jgi:hypothetical protein
MPLFTKVVLGGLAALISIPVFGLPIIAANYPSPILDHLADIVQGANTTAVAALNAPNWNFGIQLQKTGGVKVATSTTAGTVASSTAFTFAVAALDGNGTTTLSDFNTITTDASTSPNEQIRISWSAVPGAIGYAVYFATTSSATADTFTQYFYATSTNGVPSTSYVFATSTGSLLGSYNKTDPTAYSVRLNPNGTSYLNGGGLQVLGKLSAGSSTPVADLTATDAAANATTTVQLGKTGQNKGTCIKLYTDAGAAVYLHATSTSQPLYVSATACASVTGF